MTKLSSASILALDLTALLELARLAIPTLKGDFFPSLPDSSREIYKIKFLLFTILMNKKILCLSVRFCD